MSYRLIEYISGNQGLFEKRSEEYRVLARKMGGVWRLDRGEKYSGKPDKENVDRISREEAAMILFGCKDPL